MPASSSTQFVVLLASVLKPIDDTRMLGKFARTLLERPGTRVHIAGHGPLSRSAGKNGEAARVQQHGIFAGSRLSLGRLAAQWRYGRLLHELKPDLVVVHAPELLPLTLLWQALGGNRKFIYDIRENYALNVSTQQVYQGLVRRGLAAGLRWVEGLAARRAAGIILAEESYADELPFLRKASPVRVVILENKYQPAPGELLPTQPRPLPSPSEPLRLLYSGTISELNGVLAALSLAWELNKLWPGGVALTIIGFCQQPALMGRLHVLFERLSSTWPIELALIGGAEPVPHAAIVAEISRSHLGLALYQPHPSTARCRPTKLFEYLAHGLPVLVPANPLWQELVQAHDAGLMVDRGTSDYSAAAEKLRQELLQRIHRPGPAFYTNGIPTTVLWASEGKKLWHLLDSAI